MFVLKVGLLVSYDSSVSVGVRTQTSVLGLKPESKLGARLRDGIRSVNSSSSSSFDMEKRDS